MAQKNSLDNLMMTFADLSAANKGSSFKGPALKDVKIQKSTAASFQPSQKARDWSSLEQSLESVFTAQDKQPQSQPQPFQFVQPQIQPQNNNFISQNVEDDEFDDFVGPSSTQNSIEA